MNDKLNFNESSCSQKSEEESAAFFWDGENCFLGEEPFFPRVLFNPDLADGASNFNAVVISLSGELKSEDDWKRACVEAENWIKKGKAILWSLDLGLFHKLAFPLDHPGQFSALQFAINHFAEKIVSRFEKNSLGVILYHGSLDFGKILKKDAHLQEAIDHWKKDAGENNSEEICLFEIAFQFMETLAEPLRDYIKTFVIFDLSSALSNAQKMRILSRERSKKIQIIPENSEFYTRALKLQNGTLYCKKDELLPTLGILVPSLEKKIESQYGPLNSALDKLLKKKQLFRLISEENLTSEWNGLDHLIVDPLLLSKLGFRALKGFEAARGIIVSLRGHLGFIDEISFEDFFLRLKK